MSDPTKASSRTESLRSTVHSPPWNRPNLKSIAHGRKTAYAPRASAYPQGLSAGRATAMLTRGPYAGKCPWNCSVEKEGLPGKKPSSLSSMSASRTSSLLTPSSPAICS